MKSKNRNKSGKKGTIPIVAGLLLITAALAISGWNVWQDRSAGRSSETVLQELQSRIRGGAAPVGEAAETEQGAGSALSGVPLETESAGGVSGRWVFVTTGGSFTGTIGESGRSGDWVFLPAEVLTAAAEAAEEAAGCVWIFLPYRAGGIPQSADAATGRWMQIAESAVAEARERFGELPPEKKGVTYPDYVLDPEGEMPGELIDGNIYIGVLELPTLGLTLPVMGEWSYPNLRKSPCRYAGSAYSNDLIICGHNYGRHFGGLKNMRIGDTVRFTDAEGNVFSYSVAEVETLKPKAVQQMKEGDWDLTLFTCTIGGATRVTVRCERQK